MEKDQQIVLIPSFVGEFSTDYPLMMAAACMAIVPMIMTFFFFQRNFIEGIAITGLKN
ncbi:hypothetical protein ACFPYJ_01420 [Paenibacillus solisilvae]|uniref:Carbohydrate ABC transporter permease n=1 Tax=Paenibacillus solisilvae TaxID=2486751 RepID=A0ABW0VR64_9BACL